MFSTILIFSKFLLFKCIDNHADNPNMNLAQGVRNAGLDNVNMEYSSKQDFDYNIIDMFDLRQKKMIYVNCNRNIFVNSDKDLIDIFLSNKNLQTLFLDEINIFKTRIEIVRHSIANMLGIIVDSEFELLEAKNYSSENLLGIVINSVTKKLLNDELVKFNDELKHPDTVSINKTTIKVLLEVIDGYIFEGLQCNNLFLCRLKPSIIFSNDFNKKFLSLDETVEFLFNISYIYKEAWNCAESINSSISELKKLHWPKDMYTSCVLISNLFTKSYIEFIVRRIICSFRGLDEMNTYIPKDLIIYSNNANSIVEILSQAIKMIVNESLEEALSELNIQKIAITNELFHNHIFNSYEIAIHDKKYLIKKFNNGDLASLPTGLSTAYLNIHRKFTSVGYMAFEKINDDSDDGLFISIEEKMAEFFTTNKFDIFKDNENQVLWFVLDFLHVLNRLIAYKINLTSPTLLFAVEKDDKRWRFRVDDIGCFEYVSNENLYENHKFLIDTLALIYTTIKEKSICDCISRLIRHAEYLKNDENPYYIEILISEMKLKMTII